MHAHAPVLQDVMKALASFFDTLLTELNTVRCHGKNVEMAVHKPMGMGTIQRRYEGMRRHMGAINASCTSYLAAMERLEQAVPAGCAARQ